MSQGVKDPAKAKKGKETRLFAEAPEMNITL